MRIGKIASYIGIGLVTASCSVKKPAQEKALDQAAKYLKGHELVIAEQRALQQPHKESHICSQDIFYWDSLLAVNREKEYKQLGKQYIKDSIDGVYKRKPFFKLPIDDNIKQKGLEIVDSIKKEVSRYYSGEDILKLERKAPKQEGSSKYGLNDNAQTHYLGMIGVAGAERKGFETGLAEARKSLLNE